MQNPAVCSRSVAGMLMHCFSGKRLRRSRFLTKTRLRLHPFIGWLQESRGEQIVKAMKLTAVFLTVTLMHVYAAGVSQTITFSGKEVPLQKVFDVIEKQTGFVVFSNKKLLENAKPVTISANNMPLTAFLDQLLKDQSLTYIITDKTIGLQYKRKLKLAMPVTDKSGADRPPLIEIRGKVADKNGGPIAGANVTIKGARKGTVTNSNGMFTIHADSNAVLVVSYVGYKVIEVAVSGRNAINVTLEENPAAMQELVFTGMTSRRKESFTGATTSFNREEIKAIGNQNLVQSIKTLDPSFIITENNLLGSNPNALPQIEIRGKTSVPVGALRDEFSADPNQPLFILDGFETNLRTVLDLDMNRVAAVTLLKDAASTAIYGARAANGVVVIETLKPKAGKARISYIGDYRVEMPDLRDYNLMNAEEKLEFERLAGRYTVWNQQLVEEQLQLDSLYHARLQRVRSGVNTYWLNEPVRVGFTHGHSVRADGGTDLIRYGAGLQFRNTEGVMKGSGRKTWQGSLDLIYRNNRLNISNKLFVNGYTATESPYGSFSDFVDANPYYKKYNDFGKVDKYLDESENRNLQEERIVNPLYNASLNNFFISKNFQFQNNLQLVYSINNDLQLQGAVQVTKAAGEQVIYFAPEHSMFDEKGVFEKGSHSNKRINNFSYQANAMLTYGRLFGGLHQVTGNARVEIQQDKNDAYTAVAVGFPTGTNGNPAFSYGYAPNGKPATAISVFRRNNILASGSYTYDRRFVVDFSYRMDGSTAFGSGKKYSPFWSTGAAWNIHNEGILRGKRWINTLRIKANIGSTGNQNFSGITSVSVYSFESNLNTFGQGLTLATLGNRDLQWQKTMQTNVGVDFALFNNRVSGYVNVYRKYTDPLVVSIDLPASTGLYNFPWNVGHLDNKGIEANIKFSPIYQPQKRIMWTIGLTGIVQKAHYGGIGSQLEGLNKEQVNDQSLIQFKDGYSPEDLWAVHSYGIDPGSGLELFRNLDGSSTFDYDASQMTISGNSRPDVEGVMSTSFTYKGFTLGLYVRYRYGGDVFNDALYNKVENISNDNIMNNQDKRALYDRWQKAGDVARFKRISITSTTPMSSRFIQEENTLIGESINLGYEFGNTGFLKKIGMQSLRVNAYMNDIFRFSTVKRERGTDYPFARTVSFSVNTSF